MSENRRPQGWGDFLDSHCRHQILSYSCPALRFDYGFLISRKLKARDGWTERRTPSVGLQRGDRINALQQTWSETDNVDHSYVGDMCYCFTDSLTVTEIIIPRSYSYICCIVRPEEDGKQFYVNCFFGFKIDEERKALAVRVNSTRFATVSFLTFV